MSRKVQVKKQPITKPTIVRPLAIVSFENGFHFYTAIGNYTGIAATNLGEFAAKLPIIPKGSITFHFQRKDFQKWIEYTVEDATLAEKINKANGEQSAEDLRKEILIAVETSNSRAL